MKVERCDAFRRSPTDWTICTYPLGALGKLEGGGEDAAVVKGRLVSGRMKELTRVRRATPAGSSRRSQSVTTVLDPPVR